MLKVTGVLLLGMFLCGPTTNNNKFGWRGGGGASQAVDDDIK